MRSVTLRLRSTATGATAVSTTTAWNCRACRSLWATSNPRWGRVRLLVETAYPESDRVPAGEPFGSSVALPAISDAQSDDGIGGLSAVGSAQRPRARARHDAHVVRCQQLHWSAAPALQSRTAVSGLSALTAALSKIRSSPTQARMIQSAGKPEGGVVRNRAYFGGKIGDDDFNVYGLVAERFSTASAWTTNYRVARGRRLPQAHRLRRRLGRALRRRPGVAGLRRQPFALHDRARRLFQP